MATSKVHEGINLLKGFSCIIVIFLHCAFPGILGDCILNGSATAQTCKKLISSIQSPVKTLFCGTIFNGTLWYLYAIFWTWFLLYILRKMTLGSKYYLLIPVLLIIQIFGRFYFQNVYDINENIFMFRNAIVFGLPYTLTGSFIAEHEKKIFAKKIQTNF